MTKKEMMEIEKREIREDEAFVSSTSEYLHQLASRRLPWFDFKLEFAGTSDNCDRIVHALANAVHEVMEMHLNDNDRRTK